MTRSGGRVLLEHLAARNVRYVFANFGSDHPAIMEAASDLAREGLPAPDIVTCPTEMVALSAAHGFAQVTGQAQCVLVHVDCGTQSLGGAVHNAARGQVPVLILAGLSPHTQNGELPGSRNEFIHWLQDVADQRGLVRGYMRYDNEIRSARNLREIVDRALVMAHGRPAGPVYLTFAREVLEEKVEAAPTPCPSHLACAALPMADAERLAGALARASAPLIITSHIGRTNAGVAALCRLAELTGAPVLEAAPSCLNVPTDHSSYIGARWAVREPHPALLDADFILLIDCDVPWIPSIEAPREGIEVAHIDVDPLKETIPLWSYPITRRFRVDSPTALAQINLLLAERGTAPSEAVLERTRRLRREWMDRLGAQEVKSSDRLTAVALTMALREGLTRDDLVLNEGISNYEIIAAHLRRQVPGSLFTSGGGSLGWSGGAALGARLARQGGIVAALCGDGSYMFSDPSVVHWMARRYQAPILQVVYDNGGWRSPALSAAALHPDGAAGRGESIGLSFDPAADYGGIAAAAGGAHRERVSAFDELAPALSRALDVVRRDGRSAVLHAILEPL